MPFRFVCPAKGVVLALSLLSFGSSVLSAQMQPHIRYRGKLLPVVDFAERTCYVVDDGKERKVNGTAIEIRPAPAFGPETARITAVTTDLDPLQNATPAERAKPGSIRFRYEADVTSDLPVKESYGVLLFVTNGSVGTQLVALGRLTADRPRHVKIELAERVDSVGSLHVFAAGVELKSNQVTAAYNVHDDFARLTQGAHGVSAVALCRSETRYPHALSDDGARLATVRERDTHKALIVYDLKASRLLCDLKLGDRGETAWDLTWISEHELAYLTDDPRNHTTYLMLLDVATGQAEQLKAGVNRIFSAPKRQPGTLVLYGWRWSEPTGVAKFDVRKRRLGMVNTLDWGTTRFDDDGEERIRYEGGGDSIVVHYRPDLKAGWRKIDRDVKQVGLHFDLNARDSLDRTCEIHSIAPDGDTVYISTRVASDRFELAAFSMTKAAITKVVATHPKYDLTANEYGGASRLLFRKGSSELIGLIYDASKPQVVWLDEGCASVQKAIDKALPGFVNLPVDWSVDGSTFVYFSFSDQDPGTYYVFRPLESQLMPLLALGDTLKDKTLAHTTPLDFIARDGATIHAYVTHPPPDGPPGPLPLVVNIHGGPAARDSWGFSADNQFLATRGYVVLQVNYRGSSGFGAAYQKAGLYARLDTVVLDDIADGVRHLIETGEVDPGRIAVMGGSFGGWATYLSLIKYPDLYRAGIAIAAVSHWKALIRDTRSINDDKYGATYWQSLLERSDFAANEPYIDPLLRAAEIKQPVYIMHGEMDYVVRPTEAKVMLAALKKTNSHVESMSFPEASHSDWPFASRVTLLNEVEGFLQRNLAPIPPKAAQN